MKITKTVKYAKDIALDTYPDHTLVTEVPLSEPSIQASLATTCVHKVLRNGVPWWTITNRIINNFHKARFEPIYYCKRCKWIENGGHRVAAAQKRNIPVNVEIHNGCEYRRSIFGHRKNWKPPWEHTNMTIDIHIPTRQRSEMLNNLLISIQCALVEGVNVFVWFDTQEELDYFLAYHNWVDLYWFHPRVLNTQFIPPLFWNARLRETKADVFLYLCDDTEMEINCIRELKKAFAGRFPDFDGVVGIRQSNLPIDATVPAAFGAIGLKFADRFPMRNVFCPEYYAFYIDKELGLYADSVGKFHFCTSATVIHHTPGSGAKKDATNIWIRRRMALDIATNKEREKRGLLWGKNFKLIG